MYRNVIFLPLLSGLPPLLGIPHRHVNRPLGGNSLLNLHNYSHHAHPHPIIANYALYIHFLVFILLGYGTSVRQMMLNLYDLGMVTTGFAYFTFDITIDSCKGNDGRDKDACEAFEGIMDISNYIPATPEYKAFEKKVRQKMPLFAGLGYHMPPDEEVS